MFFGVHNWLIWMPGKMARIFLVQMWVILGVLAFCCVSWNAKADQSFSVQWAQVQGGPSTSLVCWQQGMHPPFLFFSCPSLQDLVLCCCCGSFIDLGI